jgi:release factor glutamine methyltransferase
MTFREALAEGRAALKGHETDTPYLDASLLLAHTCSLSRERLYMELSVEVKAVQLAEFRAAMKRRIAGEPVAWIVGAKEFWGLEYAVGPGVLCPRPDSEILIESVLEIMDSSEFLSSGRRLHDCCCGPGTLALALATERPDWQISASDISDDAAAYFERNNQTLTGGRVSYTHADLLEEINGPFEVIISNPPYLTPGETDDRISLGWKEPILALDGGGEDGLDLIRRLIPRVYDRLITAGVFLLEADPLQMPIIRQILLDTGFERPRTARDLAERERIAIAYKG